MRFNALLFFSALAVAQQVADPDFNPPIAKPAFAGGKGPLVLLDGAHANFHTVAGRYAPFARLARRDGFVIRSNTAPFSVESLKSARIVVIANALNEKNRDDWRPPHLSAFTDAEIDALLRWVRSGGSLFLIADHMPFAGAAARLGEAMGITFSNGYVGLEKDPKTPDHFTRAAGSLRDHAVADGREAGERVESVGTFTGSAFRGGETLEPILVLGPGYVSWITKESHSPVAGWLQGAALRLGKGRVAIFGEAAMFSAQLAGAQRRPMGMNHPEVPQNAQFLLNILHWLAGLI
jgi:hypothetical protein